MRLFKTIQTWRFRSRQRSLERWEQVRAKGKRHFVLRQALTLAVMMTAIRDVVDNLLNGGAQVSSLRFHIVGYFLTGILVGYVAWGHREDKFKNARLSGHI